MTVWRDSMGQYIAQGMKRGQLVTRIADTKAEAVKAWEKA